MYEIEKDIPIPAPVKRAQRTKWPFGQMDVGDSIFVPIEREDIARRQRQFGSLLWHKRPKRFTVRVVEGGLRIWRTE